MKKISKIFLKLIVLIIVTFSAEAENKIVGEGKSDAKVIVKVFSSLTCPACANWHSKIFYKMKKDYIDVGLVRFEHHPFPLDLAALNAEIILRCHVDNTKRIKFLSKIYEKQKIWAVGSDINNINKSIKKIGLEIDLKNEEMDQCFKNDNSQDEILNLRIMAQKEYKIEATPTIFINEKKYLGKIDYKQFKKAIEKKL